MKVSILPRPEEQLSGPTHLWMVIYPYCFKQLSLDMTYMEIANWYTVTGETQLTFITFEGYYCFHSLTLIQSIYFVKSDWLLQENAFYVLVSAVDNFAALHSHRKKYKLFSIWLCKIWLQLPFCYVPLVLSYPFFFPNKFFFSNKLWTAPTLSCSFSMILLWL